MANEFAKAYALDELSYDQASPREATTKLEVLDKGLDQFEKDLKKADCVP